MDTPPRGGGGSPPAEGAGGDGWDAAVEGVDREPRPYRSLGRIGRGSFGEVLLAVHVVTGEPVALKKVLLRRPEEGLPDNVLLEMKLPQAVDHPNVMRVLDAFPEGNSLVLALEYCPSDLAEVLRAQRGPFGEARVKGIMWQLLQGLDALHGARIMHRDLKPANVLVAAGGVLKLADFGLARIESPGERPQYTHTVATRWYRAPELLYGAREYGPAVDVWALGAIFGELLGLGPLLPGEHDIHQLQLVIQMFGTPDEATWPEVVGLPDYGKISIPKRLPMALEEVLPEASPGARNLLGCMLQLNPRHRPTCKEAMAHEYFFVPPYPAPPEELCLPARDDKCGRDDFGPGGVDAPLVYPDI